MGVTHHQVVKPTKRLEELDSLRGLAALTVVLHHFKMLWQFDAAFGLSPITYLVVQHGTAPFTAGRQAVILFFVLSGFVLSLPAINLRAQSYSVFLIRRVFRIYIPYLVALVLAVFGAMTFHDKPVPSEWLNLAWSSPVSWSLVLQHVMFIGVFNTDQFNPPIWSLVQEMRISLVFPLLCAAALKLRPNRSLILAASISALSILGTNAVHLGSLFYSLFETLHYMAFFILGIYLARQKESISLKSGNLAMPARAILAILLATSYLYGGHIWTAAASILKIFAPAVQIWPPYK